MKQVFPPAPHTVASDGFWGLKIFQDTQSLNLVDNLLILIFIYLNRTHTFICSYKYSSRQIVTNHTEQYINKYYFKKGDVGETTYCRKGIYLHCKEIKLSVPRTTDTILPICLDSQILFFCTKCVGNVAQEP